MSMDEELTGRSISKASPRQRQRSALKVTLPGKQAKAKPLIKVPEAKTLSKTYINNEKWGIYSLAYGNAEGTELAVGFGNGSICIYNAKKDILLKEIIAKHTFGYACTALTYMRDRKHLISTSAGGVVSVWKTNEKQKGDIAAILLEENNEVNCADVCSDGCYFATAGKDRIIRIYDSKRLELCSSSRPVTPSYDLMDDSDKLVGHSKRIFAVRFHPHDNHVFLSGGWDNCVKIWDKRILRSARRSLNGPHVCGKSIDVIGNTILTGSWTSKNSLQLWDMRMGQVTDTLPFVQHDVYHGEFIYCAKFANKSTVLAGGSGTNGVCSISTAVGMVKNEIKLDKPCYAIDSCSEGTVAAVGGLCNKVIEAKI